MTQAQKIAERFGDDGQLWEDGDGASLVDALENAGGRCWSDLATNPQRWEFADGSAIIISDGAWDLGITSTDSDDRRDCTCWSEDGVTCRYPHECECGCHAAEATA